MTNPDAGDHRRATALVCHFGHDNADGINAVLREAAEADRATPLIISVLDVHEGVVPILLTADGLACLTQMLHSAAEDQDGDQDCTRAARLIIAHSGRDHHAARAVLREAAEADRATPLIIALLTCFKAAVPLLYCDLGLTVLQRNILDWAARENTEEGE